MFEKDKLKEKYIRQQYSLEEELYSKYIELRKSISRIEKVPYEKTMEICKKYNGALLFPTRPHKIHNLCCINTKLIFANFNTFKLTNANMVKSMH